MTETQRDIASFLIRFTQDLWRTSAGDPEVQWRGVIKHVQGEDEIAFTDFAEALKFMQGHLAQLTINALSGGSKMDQEKALQEGFKLWEQFANSYSTMMFEAMERTIQQSETIRKQMDRAVEETLKTWQFPGKPAEGQPINQVLGELNSQVTELSKKIEHLEKTISKIETEN